MYLLKVNDIDTKLPKSPAHIRPHNKRVCHPGINFLQNGKTVENDIHIDK